MRHFPFVISLLGNNQRVEETACEGGGGAEEAEGAAGEEERDQGRAGGLMWSFLRVISLPI